MTNSADVITITMRKRAWWILSWIASAVLAAIGVVLWLRQGRSRRLGESNEQP